MKAGRKEKTDAYDARSAAIVSLRHRNRHAVTSDDHVQVLRLLARRHHQLIAGRTRAICRLHALLATMVAGGLPPKLTAQRAAAELGEIRPTDAVGRERKHIAVEFLDEVRRHDRAIGELEQRVKVAVATANSNVTTVYGVGPIVACYLLGYGGDIRRFPTAGHYARYTRLRRSRRRPARKSGTG